jgi:hypothetical protein
VLDPVTSVMSGALFVRVLQGPEPPPEPELLPELEFETTHTPPTHVV